MKRILAAFSLLLCFAMTSYSQKPTQEQLQAELETGIVNFVASVKAVLPNGGALSVDEFKLNLIGEANMGSITTEGNNLLTTVHSLLASDARPEQIKELGLKPFAQAMAVVLEHEKEGYSGRAFSSGSVHLFGGNEGAILGGSEARQSREAEDKCGEPRSCKWYQLGCHAHNVGVWICEHKDLLAGIAYTVMTIYYIVALL